MVISTGLMCAMGFLTVAAATDGKSAPTSPAISSRGETLPATYAGEIPCADCSGQRLVLTLFPDHTFRLRQTYVSVAGGKDEDHYDLGRWARAQDDGDQLRVKGGTEAPRFFRFVDKDRLRMLDNEGRGILSKLNYDLVRQADFDPVAGPMLLRGLYAYMADSATFNECLTGTRSPVSIEVAHIDIERAYTARTEGHPGMPLLATLTARFVKREPEPGTPPREYLLVEKFDRFWPGETCARQAMSKASLTNTYWRPVEIAGKPVTVADEKREPHVIFVPGENTVRGFGGCNRLQGRYEVQEKNSLRFIGTATTRMFCQEAMEQEGALLQAIEATANYKILGETLELYDMNGRLLARFESRYLR